MSTLHGSRPLCGDMARAHHLPEFEQSFKLRNWFETLRRDADNDNKTSRMEKKKKKNSHKNNNERNQRHIRKKKNSDPSTVAAGSSGHQ